MSGDDGGRRQRAVMATDDEWERIGRRAAASGMELSRFVIGRALASDSLPPEVLRRAVREMLAHSMLEEKRLRDAGLGKRWEDACDAVDEWIDREGMLERLTDPGAANRWKAVGRDGTGRKARDRGGGTAAQTAAQPALHARGAGHDPGAGGGGRQDGDAPCAGPRACRRPGPPSAGADGGGAARAQGWHSRGGGVRAGAEARASGRQRSQPAGGDLVAGQGAGAVRRARRGRRAKPSSRHISISATDGEWGTVRRHADRRGLSIARYLVGLVERGGPEEIAGPALALDAAEQRELLEAVRGIRSLMLEGADAAPLVRDMQERIAVQFAAWMSAMAGAGREEDLVATLASVLGEARARLVAASVMPAVAEEPGVDETTEPERPAPTQGGTCCRDSSGIPGVDLRPAGRCRRAVRAAAAGDCKAALI